MARFYWFRFYCDAHGKGKTLALSDGEFRLLTRIWSLARMSERPGWVYVVPGVGWAARDLWSTAGCKSGKPEEMLRRLEQLRFLVAHEGGVIEVHDWEEHNPPAPPSKSKEAMAAQKRREREEARRQPTDGDVGTNVGIMSEADSLPIEKRREEKRRSCDLDTALSTAERPTTVERLRVAVSQRLGIVGPGGKGLPPCASRRLGQVVRDANAAVEARGFDAVVEALQAAAESMAADGRPAETFGAFAYALSGLARPDAPEHAPPRPTGPRSSRSWWHRLTREQLEAHLAEREALAPELGPDAPLGLTRVERGGTFVELPELVSLNERWKEMACSGS